MGVLDKMSLPDFCSFIEPALITQSATCLEGAALHAEEKWPLAVTATPEHINARELCHFPP